MHRPEDIRDRARRYSMPLPEDTVDTARRYSVRGPKLPQRLRTRPIGRSDRSTKTTIPNAMLLVVSHLGAPPSGRVRCEANYTAGGSEALSPNH